MKLKQKQQGSGEGGYAGEYYVVVSGYSVWYVTGEVASRIGRKLDRPWQPRWLKFADISGSRVWLRTSTISYVCESTELQRSRDRDFQARQREEEEARDRRWDEEG